MFSLVLLPVEANLVLEERSGKENLGRPRGSSGSKVVLTLLTEVVAVHVELSVVYVRKAGLQLLPGHLGDDESCDESGSGSWSSTLQNSLKNPLQVILGILEDIISNGRLWLWRSSRLFGNF